MIGGSWREGNLYVRVREGIHTPSFGDLSTNGAGGLARLCQARLGENSRRLFLRQRDAVAVEDGAGVDGSDARAGGDGAGEVEGVDGADADEFAFLFHAADFAEGLDGFGAGVLLAVEAGDEAAASDGAARFHAAKGAEDVAPGDGDVLALDEVAEDDAVAEEELFGPGFGELFGVGDECRVLSSSAESAERGGSARPTSASGRAGTERCSTA